MPIANTKIKVGTHSLNYAEKRLFAGLTFENYEVKKLKDFIKIPAHLYWRIYKKPHPFLTNLFFDAGFNKAKLMHFFNAVSMGNQPWITSFERYLPRDILYRPKQGFVTPIAEWLRGPLAGAARGIAAGSLAQTGFFDAKAIAALAEAHIAGRTDHSRTLWQLLMLEKSLTQLGVTG